jgi:NAD(P)-dependent dehydrogenase (short-subunit alcohol dehydrogenase family)
MTQIATFHDLKDASVFITGGGSGIGASLTDGFLGQGAKVAFIGRSDASEFVDQMAAKHGTRPHFIQGDITDTAVLKAAIDQAGKAHGPITALVNNAANDKRHSTAEVDSEATLDATEDSAFDALFLAIGLFEAIPGGLAAGQIAGDDGFAAGVFNGTQEDFDLVADFDLGGLARICEFLEFDAAFHLVADIDDGLARFDGDDLAFDNRALFGRVDFEAFVQEGLEFLHRCVLSHVAMGFLFIGF